MPVRTSQKLRWNLFQGFHRSFGLRTGRLFWCSSPHRQVLKPEPGRVSKGYAGFLGRAQIDGQALFAYTESETMQGRRGL